MRRALSGRGVTAFMSFVLMALLMGCQPQPQTPNEKQARLYAAENMELRERLADQQAKTEALRKQQTKESEQRDRELAQCKARNDQLHKDLEGGIAQRVNDVTAAVVDENAKLRAQIEELRAQTEKLKTQQ